MRNERGVTMIALIIMIILILLMVGTGVFTGIDAYKTMEAQTFIAQMKIVREKIYVIREEYKSWDRYNGENIQDYIMEKYTVIGNSGGEDTIVFEPKKLESYNIEIQNKFTENLAKTTIKNDKDKQVANYFYFTAKDLDDALGLSNLDINVFINFDTGTFLEEDGVTAMNFAGKTSKYYVLDELLNAQNGVFGPGVGGVVDVTEDPLKIESIQFVENNKDNTILKFKINKIYDNNSADYSIHIMRAEDLETKNKIEKANIKFDISEKELEVTLKMEPAASAYVGNVLFEIKIKDEIITTPQIEIVKVNDPVISDSLSAQIKKVGWTEFEEYEIKDNENGKDDESAKWYNYSESSKKWANIKMPDGSYYVWIPRFAYCIEDGKIDILFLSGTSTKTFDGIDIKTNTKYSTKYHIPQAFTASGGPAEELSYDNGEYSEELPGIWVSKYECTITKDDSKDAVYFIKSAPFLNLEGNASLSYESLLYKARTMVGYLDEYGFNVTIERPEHGIDNKFPLHSQYAETDDLFKNNETHLIKNSEWAAVSYLAYSKYGSNGNPLALGLKYTAGETDKFNESSIETSTTKNEYGIFDMTNTRPEFVATFSRSSSISTSATSGLGNKSSMFATLYEPPRAGEDVLIDAPTYGDGIKELRDKFLDVEKENYITNTNKILVRGGNSLFDYDAVLETANTAAGNIGVRMVWIMKK